MSRSVYLPGYKQVAHHEWRTAENCAAYLLPTLQQMAKASPELKLLDIGAGPGTITTTLAKYMPQGSVVAVDISAEILDKAARHAADVRATNVTFQQGNVFELPFEDDSFDVVHAHQVLCHLDLPVDAMREMLRVCKPGGIVASREAAMEMWCFHPAPPGLVTFHKLIRDTMAASGGHPDAGPQLVSWAMQAGVQRDRILATFGTWCYSTPDDRKVWGGSMAERIRNGEMRKKALKEGWVTEEQLEDMGRGWDEWIAAEDASMGCMHGEVLVRK